MSPESFASDLASRTWLYRLLAAQPAGAKLLALLLVSSFLVMVSEPAWLATCALLSASLWLLLGRSQAQRDGSGSVLWFLIMLIMLAGYNAWAAGLAAAVVTISRLIALVLLALVVMRTTRVTDMMSTVERVLEPLGRLGWVRPARIALAFGMTIRFLPVLKQQWEEIRQAQMARGLQARPHALLVPMLARTLQRAEEISQTLDARGMGD